MQANTAAEADNTLWDLYNSSHDVAGDDPNK